MKGNKNNIIKYMNQYISTTNDGVEYVTSATVKRILGEIPTVFENVVAYTEIDSRTGAKKLNIRTMSLRAPACSVYIFD